MNETSNKIITKRVMLNNAEIGDFGIATLLTFSVGGVLTAVFASMFSLWFLCLAAVLLGISSLVLITALKDSLNEITRTSTDYNLIARDIFNKRDTLKILLHMPLNKSLNCNVNDVYMYDRYGNRNDKILKGTYTYHVESAKGQLRMVKKYQEYPNYTWDTTFKNATQDHIKWLTN